MKTICGREYLEMKDAVKYLGISRSTIIQHIALTKKGRMKPPFPYFSPFASKQRTKYFFLREALDNWVDMRSVG